MFIAHKILGLVVAMLCISASTLLHGDNSPAQHPSPYLAMHADDPIDWQIWDNSVIKQAQQQNKLIFVSVGYFSCHWCHVMQRESFSNIEVAQILNRDYISVKIDRELRPDLDRRLIQFVNKTRGSAGWPLNVFLTPEGYPLTGFTYLPRAGFTDVLQQLQQQWLLRRDEIAGAAAELFIEMQNEALAIDNIVVTERSDENLIQSFLSQAMLVADHLQGGFGDVAKFPQIPQLLALIELIGHSAEIDEEVGEFVHLTLRAMAERNLMDHINGGFFRYTTDPDWQTPHYEKMLYDNAQMVLLYYQAERLWPDRGYRQVAETTLQFVLSSMRHPEGGYVSSLSAVDTNNLEGGAYLWDWPQLLKVLSEEQSNYIRNLWKNSHIDAEQPFLTRPLVGIGSSGNAEINSKIRQRLQSIERPIMPIDDKRLASWNALMLQALVLAASFDQQYRLPAEQQYEFMRDRFVQNGEVIRFAGNAGLAETGFEDYAHVSLAFVQYDRLFQQPEATRLARILALKAYRQYFNNNRWYRNSASIIPTDPGQWVIQDAVSPSAQTAWLKVVIALPEIEREIGNKANDILHRVTQQMLDTPYYYGSLIALRSRLDETSKSKTMN